MRWILGLVCAPGSIKVHIVAGVRRDDTLARPDLLDPPAAGPDRWWYPATPVARP